MPFLAPLAATIAPKIGSAIGGLFHHADGTSTGLGGALGQIGGAVGSSLLGSKLSQAKPNAQESAVTDLLMKGMQTGQNVSSSLVPQGTSLLQQGAQGYAPVMNYFSSLLGGNRSAMTSNLAPEMNRINEGYGAAKNASASLMPRGGPSATFNSELPFQQQRDISTLLQSQRPQAAQGLLGASNAAVGAGNEALGRAGSFLSASTGPGQTILGLQNQLRQIEQQRGQATGAGLFDTFSKFGMPALQKQWPSIFGGGGVEGT